MPQAISSLFHPFACRGIEQDPRLIAIFSNAITLQIQIRQHESGVGILFGDRLPQPLCRLGVVAFLACRPIQVAQRHGKLFGAASWLSA